MTEPNSLRRAFDTASRNALIPLATQRVLDLVRSAESASERMRRLTSEVVTPYRDFLESPATRAVRTTLEQMRVLDQQAQAFQARFELPLRLEPLLVENCAALSPLTHAIEQMRSPWLDSLHRTESVVAMARLHDLSRSAASQLPPFSDELTEKLRLGLGSWQSAEQFGVELSDPFTRLSCYTDHGFDPSLTEFPDFAVGEAFVLSGLAPKSTERDRQEDDSNTDSAPESTREELAFSLLTDFERRFRCFIAERLEDLDGPKWCKRRVPPDRYKAWREKQAAHVAAGGDPDIPLVEFADFSDYLDVIVRNDNWGDVFSVVFKRKTNISESLNRLGPVRIATMHARFLTAEDELYMRAEVTRILRAIDAQ